MDIYNSSGYIWYECKLFRDSHISIVFCDIFYLKNTQLSKHLYTQSHRHANIHITALLRYLLRQVAIYPPFFYCDSFPPCLSHSLFSHGISLVSVEFSSIVLSTFTSRSHFTATETVWQNKRRRRVNGLKILMT